MCARTVVIAMMLALVCAGRLAAQPAAQDLAPRLTLSGTSTVRAWSCPAEGVMKVTPGKAAPPVSGFPQGVQTVVVTVPVKAIACEDEMMVEHLREALKEKTYPNIVYQLVQYTLTGPDTATASGRLTIMGVTRPIKLEVKLVPSPQGPRSTGETTIDMTSFAITPPTIWQGLLKVGKDVRVRFDALLPSS